MEPEGKLKSLEKGLSGPQVPDETLACDLMSETQSSGMVR